MDLSFEAIKMRIIAKFATIGSNSQFVGIRKYVSKTSIANFVVIVNCNWSDAVSKTVERLNALTSLDFEAIAVKFGVNNVSGIKYSNNSKGIEYLNSGKLPKEGTKARDIVLESIKISKTLAEIRNEMVGTYLDNRVWETKSNSSKGAIIAYDHITNAIKYCKATNSIHIFAFAHSKEVLAEGTYKDSSLQPETLQKNAIIRYCKELTGEVLPTEKYRNFVVLEDQLESIAVDGDRIYLK